MQKQKTKTKINLPVEPSGAPRTINPQKTTYYNTGLAQEKKFLFVNEMLCTTAEDESEVRRLYNRFKPPVILYN